jgi:hypothetical protein
VPDEEGLTVNAAWLALSLLPVLAYVVGGWLSDALTRRQMRRYRATTKDSQP